MCKRNHGKKTEDMDAEIKIIKGTSSKNVLIILNNKILG
jgi:hypothetical protein